MVITLTQFRDMKERARIINLALEALSQLNFVKEIYLFGSTLSGEITGSSDIDLLIIVDNDPKKAYIEINQFLESKLGEKAYNIDIHVVNIKEKDKSPHKWFIKKGKKIT